MGYGIAVPEPGRAVPYLIATMGQPLTRIGELKIFGFRSVIDIGTPIDESKRHRLETEATGMRYFNIALTTNIPTTQQSTHFNEIVLNANNSPLLIYAPRAELIGIMWASYRIALGSPLEFVLQEGRSLGLTKEQETKLRNRKLHTNSSLN